MGNWKIPLVILVTLALLVLFACFPAITSAVQDWEIMHRSAFGQIEPLQLDIRSSVPAMGKLAMMCRQEALIEVSPDLAALTPSEVEQIACEAIGPYVDAGMADPFHQEESEFYVVRPVLVQVPEMPELSGIIWDVELHSDASAYYEFTVAIDDETGKVLLVGFHSDYVIAESELSGFLDAFAEIFFTGLEIEDYQHYVTTDMEKAYVGDQARAVRYSFPDTDFGQINVEFYVYQHGFYMEFY